MRRPVNLTTLVHSSTVAVDEGGSKAFGSSASGSSGDCRFDQGSEQLIED